MIDNVIMYGATCDVCEKRLKNGEVGEEQTVWDDEQSLKESATEEGWIITPAGTCVCPYCQQNGR